MLNYAVSCFCGGATAEFACLSFFLMCLIPHDAILPGVQTLGMWTLNPIVYLAIPRYSFMTWVRPLATNSSKLGIYTGPYIITILSCGHY